MMTMKLFPDKESRKRFMKSGLPVMLGIVWSPIIWMTISSLLERPIFSLTGSWVVTQAIILAGVIPAIVLLLRFFVRIGEKFHDIRQ
ncbi:MAG: hypothetical protein WCH05_02955 [Chlorobiaceae bacterium]